MSDPTRTSRPGAAQSPPRRSSEAGFERIAVLMAGPDGESGLGRRLEESFAGLAGFDASSIDKLMEQNETMIEAAGVRQSSYTAAGDDHTILLRDSLYTLEVEGVPLLDWLTAFLAGEEVDDVSCVDCS